MWGRFHHYSWQVIILNRIWRYIRGYLIVTLVSANPETVLNDLSRCRIPFWNVHWVDEFTVRVRIFLQDKIAVMETAKKSISECDFSYKISFLGTLGEIKQRCSLWLGLLLGIILLLVVQQFVFFYEVNGNITVSDAVIMRALDEIGVGVGTYGPQIKTQWVENHVLNLVDGLQWITINQSGCKAIVEVRERQKTPMVDNRKGFCNVVASRAGIVESQSVWSGQAVQEVGDAVLEGELLVSGVVDLERTFLLTRAQAEIFARTWREYKVITPATYIKKGAVEKKFECIWLEIGNNRIKIFGNSGISTASCDKMIDRKILSLPGGNELPIALVFESSYLHFMSYQESDMQWVQARLRDVAASVVNEQMVAGEILQQRETILLDDGILSVYVQFDCREMIAKSMETNWIEEEYEYD